VLPDIDGGVGYVYAKDPPLYSDSGTLVQKLDAQTGNDHGRDDPGGLFLAAGEFTVKYWSAYHDTANAAYASGPSARTWVLKTEEHGVIDFRNARVKPGSDALYMNGAGDVVLPLGTITVQETAPPAGYMLPVPNETAVIQVVADVGSPTGVRELVVTVDATTQNVNKVERKGPIEVMEQPHEVEVEKLDETTGGAVDDTEFTLYKYIGAGAPSVAELPKAPDADWQPVAVHKTGEGALAGSGKCLFSPVAVGSYKLAETRSAATHAASYESGDGPHYFRITDATSSEVQVFENNLAYVSCEVYDQTIRVTDTAFDGTGYGFSDNTGAEQHIYSFAARSTSNVSVDEFAITNDLSDIVSRGYRLTDIWTGTTPVGLDYDGRCALLYKTNLADKTEPPNYATNPLADAYDNPNNLQDTSVWTHEPGWRLWQDSIDVTQETCLPTAGLNLADDEYIYAIRIVYGGVKPGFFTGAYFADSGNPGYENYADAMANNRFTNAADPAYEHPVTWDKAFPAVDWAFATKSTVPIMAHDVDGNENVMWNTAQSHIATNAGVLQDDDTASVQTAFVSSFVPPSNSFAPFTYLEEALGLPKTSDSISLCLYIAFLALLAIGIVVLIICKRRRARVSLRVIRLMDEHGQSIPSQAGSKRKTYRRLRKHRKILERWNNV
jgi:hypothetical protein